MVKHLHEHLVGYGRLLLCWIIRDNLPSCLETEDGFGACVKLHSCSACFRVLHEEWRVLVISKLLICVDSFGRLLLANFFLEVNFLGDSEHALLVLHEGIRLEQVLGHLYSYGILESQSVGALVLRQHLSQI